MAHLYGLPPDAGVATCSPASLSAGTRYAARLAGDAPVTITTLPDRSGIWSTLNVGFGGRHCLWIALEYLSASHIPAMTIAREKLWNRVRCTARRSMRWQGRRVTHDEDLRKP